MRKWILIFLRSLFISAFIVAIDRVIDLGTNPAVICLSAIVGAASGGLLAGSRLRFRGLFGAICAAAALFYLGSKLIFLLPVTGDKGAFLPVAWLTHASTLGLAFLIAILSTFAFFRNRHVLTLELIAASGICVVLLAGHRHYHLDAPRFINTLAWRLGLPPHTLLVACGVAVAISLLLYTFAGVYHLHSTSPARGEKARERRRLLSIVAVFSLFVLLAAGVGRYVLSTYDLEKGLTTNGVGEATEEGSSPLGFHSALGSTNQPAALVRLEGDYSQNPFIPMLYLRESALSKFNGKEIVIAGGNFDRDVTYTHPKEPYLGTPDDTLNDRVEVVQSVYLLTDQKDAFAIDYPITIRQLKNPDSKRFQSSYRAYSLAPAFKLDSLSFEQVGDPRWSEDVRAHYLEKHPDSRYEMLALRLTENSASPIDKAFSILSYLSDKSIYTLTPNHDVEPDADPVAPYLFGDMRGYCVHFAHATVYMLRALGIPSRIGTGYLTDLSQSKDGHILLRMSDRHAWAEVYIAGSGWVPFDIEPQNVESAAETTVDMQLLEELMAKLEPGEEILPPDALEGESNVFPDDPLRLPSAGELGLILFAVIASFLTIKFYQRYSWLLPANSRTTLVRSYRALLFTLADLGLRRRTGETVSEFSRRLERDAAIDLSISRLFLSGKYCAVEKFQASAEEISSLRARTVTSFRGKPRWKRILGFLNPSTLLMSPLQGEG